MLQLKLYLVNIIWHHKVVCASSLVSGHVQRVFSYVLALNDSSKQGSRCMASVVVMHCPVTPIEYVFSMGGM